MTEKRVQLVVSGRVQGVGFRYYTVDAAQQLGVTGFVRNQWNGDVEAVAEGEESLLRQFAAAVRKGPAFSRVDHCKETWSESTGEFATFTVRR